MKISPKINKLTRDEFAEMVYESAMYKWLMLGEMCERRIEELNETHQHHKSECSPLISPS